jgi:hypothetical protein
MDIQSGMLPRKMMRNIAAVWKAKSEAKKPIPANRLRLWRHKNKMTSMQTISVTMLLKMTVRMSSKAMNLLRMFHEQMRISSFLFEPAMCTIPLRAAKTLYQGGFPKGSNVKTSRRPPF